MLRSDQVLSIKTIANILIKRYNEELIELDNQFHNGFISRDEFNNNCLYFHNLYFNSSLIGQRIKHIYKDDLFYLNNDNKKVS